MSALVQPEALAESGAASASSAAAGPSSPPRPGNAMNTNEFTDAAIYNRYQSASSSTVNSMGKSLFHAMNTTLRSAV